MLTLLRFNFYSKKQLINFSMAISVQLMISVICSAVICSDAVEVSTRNGIIIGSNHLQSRGGNVIYSFTGIPYAQPPVGKLRFKEAKPVEPWTTPLNATGPCPVCAQNATLGWHKGKVILLGKEDCLSLNVYTTSLNSEKKLPVMVFVHGGAYFSLYTMAQPEFLADEVVLVDMTYRLGALGFATTGDGVIPGNLGLKDQVLALKWVHENIHQFGGDPNSVTIFGASAGGSSAHLLLLSPLTKGLIHRGISMSGTASCPWAMNPRNVAVDRTKALAVLCGCPSEPSTELLECLQNLPLRSILEMQNVFMNEYYLPITPFAPIVEEPAAENAFLTSDPKDIESDIPWITGITSAEHIGWPQRFLDRIKKFNLDVGEHFDMFLRRWLSFGFNIERKYIPSVADRIKDFYFGTRQINKENLYKMDEMIADGWFLKGVIDAVSQHKGNTYLYLYDYLQSNASFFSIIGHGLNKGKGVSHQDDILSIFPMSQIFPKRSYSDMDLQVSKKMVSLWTTFAKSGSLTTNNVTHWEPVTKDPLVPKYSYLHISAAGFEQKEDLLTSRVSFWRSLSSDDLIDIRG